jgi:hypothetical protein
MPKDINNQNELSKRTCAPCITLAAVDPNTGLVHTVAVEAIKSVHGKVYTYGPTAPTLYVASGGSNDYTYGALNATYSYTVELRDTGTALSSYLAQSRSLTITTNITL